MVFKNNNLIKERTPLQMFQCVVIGTSAGGFDAISKILPPLPRNFPIPIIIVRHIHPESDNNYFIQEIDKKCQLKLKEADAKEAIIPGYIYVAPPNYHLLVEKDKTFSLSIDERVKYARPSIDVLFESASEVYDSQLIGIILTGANDDGAEGSKMIKEKGGIIIVQDPKTAEVDRMPLSVIETCNVDYILPLNEIPHLLVKLAMGDIIKSHTEVISNSFF